MVGMSREELLERSINFLRNGKFFPPAEIKGLIVEEGAYKEIYKDSQYDKMDDPVIIPVDFVYDQ